jgi:hypothetical protein
MGGNTAKLSKPCYWACLTSTCDVWGARELLLSRGPESLNCVQRTL